MELPVKHKLRPYFHIFGIANDDSGVERYEDLSGETDITVIFTDGENKLTWKSTDLIRPVSTLNSELKYVYVSATDLATLNLGTISVGFIFSSVSEGKVISNESELSPCFTLIDSAE